MEGHNLIAELGSAALQERETNKRKRKKEIEKERKKLRKRENG